MSENAPTADNNTAPAPEAEKMFPASYVQSLRDEAAGYRTSIPTKVAEAEATTRAAVEAEYQAKLAEATEAHNTVSAGLEAKNLELMKLNAALDAGVPSDQARKFAGLLQGVTEDEIKSNAEEAKTLFNLNPTQPNKDLYDPSQGSGQSHIPLNGDPILDKLMSIVNK